MMRQSRGMDGGLFEGLYIDIDGRPIERTPHTHPYSYDEFLVYKSADFDRGDRMVYHDRMMQWNEKAFRDAVRETWPDKPNSQVFYVKRPDDVNKFLTLYFGEKVKLTAILQGCNVSNGYPYWVFVYKMDEDPNGCPR